MIECVHIYIMERDLFLPVFHLFFSLLLLEEEKRNMKTNEFQMKVRFGKEKKEGREEKCGQIDRDRQTDRQLDKQSDNDRQTEKQTGELKDRQSDRQTDKQTDELTDRQRE